MKNLYEVFDEFERASTKEEKVDVLRRNASYSLKSVLQGTFNPDIKFVFKEIPEYTPSDSPPGLGYASVKQELDKAYLYVENHPKVSPNLTIERKTNILIQVLEALEAREAEVFAGMIMKKLPVKGLTKAIVKEAFPDIL